MKTLRRPSDGQLIEYLLRVAELPLNQCASAEKLRTVQQSVLLGEGVNCYEHARLLLLTWAMIPTDLVELFWPQRPVLTGTTVATGMWTRGFFWLNPCRITDLQVESFSRDPADNELGGPDLADGDEPAGDALTRVVWHTVEGHVLVGEQSFSVRYHSQTGEVRYEITGAAQPTPRMRIHSRPIQSLRQTFVQQSCVAMQKAMAAPPPRLPSPIVNSLARGV